MPCQKPKSCTGCPLNDTPGASFGFSELEGYGSSGVAVIAESLGQHEYEDGLPLRPQAPAGSIFQQAIRRMGVDRSTLTISNVCRCRPKNNFLDGAPYEVPALEHCRQYTDKLIEQRKPKVLVALGGVALRTLTRGEYGTVKQGEKKSITAVRGFILDSIYGIPLISSYHPSYLLRGSKTRSKDEGGAKVGSSVGGGMHLLDVMQRDLGLALLIAKTGRPERPRITSINALRDDAVRFYEECLANPHLTIYYDIETEESSNKIDESEIENTHTLVTQIQFGINRYSAIVFPGFDCEWSKEYSQKILALPNKKAAHNAYGFDLKVLRENGVNVEGITIDTQDLFHFLFPDHPKGLQFCASWYIPYFLPWKHLIKSDPLGYGAMDIIAPYEVLNACFKEIDERGMRNTYDRHIEKLREILIRTSARGFPVNSQHQEEFAAEIKIEQDRLDFQMQAVIPNHLRPVKQKDGYVKPPKELLPLLADNPGSTELTVLKDALPITYVKRKFLVTPKAKKGSLDTILEEHEEERWAQLEPFTPSPQQLQGYINWQRGLEIEKRLAKGQSLQDAERLAKYKIPVVKNKQKEDKETTGEKELRKLAEATGDKLLFDVLENRKYDKLAGTYLSPEWRPADGLVHTRFLFAPATGQLSSRSPNIQNYIKRGKLALSARKIIEAKPGRVLIEIDKTSFHAQTLAFEAQDKDYFRVAKIDIHSFVTVHRLKLPERDRLMLMTDNELKDILNWYKKQSITYLREGGKTFKEIRDSRSKPCIAEGELVLTNNGLKPIENVTIADRVWDGIEWVSHSGVICKGIKKVITYEGLTATPDHEVYTHSGWKIPFREASLCLERLEKTGLGGQAIRASRNYFAQYPPREKVERCEEKMVCLQGNLLSLPNVWEREVDIYEQPVERFNRRLPELRTNYIQTFNDTRQTIRCNSGTLSAPMDQEICGLRGARNREPILFSEGIHTMGGEESTPRNLQRNRDRQNRQRRALRAGKFEVINPQREYVKPQNNRIHGISGGAHKVTRLYKSEPVYGLLDSQIGERPTYDRRTSHTKRNRNGSEETCQELETSKSSVRRVRVYDILNAGPRHRFTVSGCLVSNCILGIGFSQGANSLFQQNPESYSSKKEVQEFLDLLHGIFPRIFAWQEEIKRLSHKQGYLLTRYKYIRRFNDVYRWDLKKWNQKTGKAGDWANGDDAEAAVAFLPANDAFGMIREEMLRLSGYGGWLDSTIVGPDLLDKYGFCNTIHDSLMFHCEERLKDECMHFVKLEMERPSDILFDDVIAPNGLSVSAGISIGKNWGKHDPVKNPGGLIELG